MRTRYKNKIVLQFFVEGTYVDTGEVLVLNHFRLTTPIYGWMKRVNRNKAKWLDGIDYKIMKVSIMQTKVLKNNSGMTREVRTFDDENELYEMCFRQLGYISTKSLQYSMNVYLKPIS